MQMQLKGNASTILNCRVFFEHLFVPSSASQAGLCILCMVG